MNKNSERIRNVSKQGSALVILLVFMTFVLLLGSVLLAGAQYATAQSVAMSATEREYYAAESSALLAAQMFAEKFNDELSLGNIMVFGKIIEPYEPSDLEIQQWIIDNILLDTGNDFYEKVENIYNETVFAVKGMPISNGNVTFADYYVLLGIPEDIRILSFDERIIWIADNLFKHKTKIDLYGNYVVDIYLNCPIFTFAATSNERSVSVYQESYVEEKNMDGGVGVINGGGFYNNYFLTEGLIYQSNNGQIIYDAIKTDLGLGIFTASGLIGMANLTSATVLATLPSSDTVTIPGSPGSNTIIYPDSPIYGGKARINKTMGNLEITGYGRNNTYENLEYINISNVTLTISGTVNFPKLKGVYISGNSGKLVIAEGARINGVYQEGSTVPIFLIEGRNGLEINAARNNDGVINSCLFCVKNNSNISISIENGTLTTNSIFISAGTGLNGKIVMDLNNANLLSADNFMPQFIAQNGLSIYLLSNENKVSGMFATPSTNPIFWVYADDITNLELEGIFVANCGFGGVPELDPAHRIANDINALQTSNAIIANQSKKVGGLNNALGITLYESIVNNIMAPIPHSTPTQTDFTFSFTNLTIRDTTWE